MLSEAQKEHLERVLYPRALADAAEQDSQRNRQIAASDYWQFLQLGGGTDAAAAAAIARGLRGCVAAREAQAPDSVWFTAQRSRRPLDG